MKYDYLLVGAGLFSSVFAHEAVKHGKTCLLIDRRSHIGGNIYTDLKYGINVLCYGPHIFHTDKKEIWQYISQFVKMNTYINSPIANYKGRIYNLPFNMNTFNRIWPEVITPEQAIRKIADQTSDISGRIPQNLEEQAMSLVGKDIYYLLIKGYTEKQWGRSCTELSPSIIKRLPVRFTYNNNYYDDPYQGIPDGGYTHLIEKMIRDCDISVSIDYFSDKPYFDNIAKKIIFTGRIDEYFEYSLGVLEYRSLYFETETKPMKDYQGTAVVNYTDADSPYTRIIEHKHFECGMQPVTVITREYPRPSGQNNEPYYPVGDKKNFALYKKYAELSKNQNRVIFGGRLGMYRYFDMDDTVIAALNLAKDIL
jgi:UDP-galactopyranose mutase